MFGHKNGNPCTKKKPKMQTSGAHNKAKLAQSLLILALIDIAEEKSKMHPAA
jgi:hypothetical protein